MQLETDMAIRQLLARYADCVFRHDAAGYAACWSKDGEWRLLGLAFQGRDAVVAGWRQFMDPIWRVWHTASNLALEADGDRVYGRVYMEETLHMPDGTKNLVRGIYHDVFCQEDGRWVFARRQVDFFYLGPTDLSGRFFTPPDFGAGARDPNPDRPATPSMQEAYG